MEERRGELGSTGIRRDPRRRLWRQWRSRSDSGDERRGWGGVEGWGEAADDLQRLEGGLFIAGQRRGGGGTRRATCPRVGDGAVSAGATKAHEKRREGDEEGEDERQRLTESSKARGRTEKRT